MQFTEFVHPGGKPSHSKPSDEIPQHGAVKFYRQVTRARGQSQEEDVSCIGEDGVVPEEGEMEQEVVEGYLYQWASNICHLNDTKVKVEDLSDREIDCQLAQTTQELLSKLLERDAEEMQVSAYSKSEQHGGVITEDFTIPGPLGDWRVFRKTYPDIDARGGSNSQYSTSPIAKRILAEAERKAGPAPSDAQVKHVACRILTDKRVELPSGAAEIKWAKILREAHENLYNHRADASFQSRLNDELSGTARKPLSLTPGLVDLVERNLLKGKNTKNKFHQFLLDGEASNLCQRVEGFDVVILRDGENKLICGVVTEAVQKLFAAETVNKMTTAAEAFVWRFPYKRPDDFRHPTSQAVHLAAYPDKDLRSKECQQPHFAVCGVEHYGLHHEVGHASGFKGLFFKEFSSPICRSLPKTSAWKEEFPKLKGGVYDVAAKVSRLVLEAWDPKLYKDYLEVLQSFPESLRMILATTGENPYGFMAQLVDTLTEGHTDWTDWEQGMAALACFGNFTGGDLVLKELGVRIAFPSGSNCHLRGQGLHHLISSYEGIRHSLVLTNKESVRRTASSLDDFSKQERARAAKLESKNPKDWSDDENKLHQAHKEGRNAMLEYAWDQIKESSNQEKREKAREKEAKRKEADNSKQDHLEEPPKKTAKTTKTAS